MTNDERAQLFGGELTKAVDKLAACWPLSAEQATALSDLLAAALGRVTSLAASKVVEQYQLVERVAALEAREAGRE